MTRAKTVALDGVALLDKPEGITANAALQRVRRALGAAKAGHTGTLDPMATGLMLLAFGEATKFAQRWLEADKVYLTRVRFGVATSTGDAEGEVIARAPVSFGAEALQAVLPRFLGTIEQVPPMVSALKHEGKPLYRYAREGVVIERAARPVTIHELRLIEWDEALAAATLYARVGKGTYIRTLAEDLGAALGVPAHIDRLRRQAIGPFSLEEARTLTEWEEGEAGGNGSCRPMPWCAICLALHWMWRAPRRSLPVSASAGPRSATPFPPGWCASMAAMTRTSRFSSDWANTSRRGACPRSASLLI